MIPYLTSKLKNIVIIVVLKSKAHRYGLISGSNKVKLLALFYMKLEKNYLCRDVLCQPFGFNNKRNLIVYRKQIESIPHKLFVKVF